MSKIIGFCRYSVLTDTGRARQIGKRREWRAYKSMLLNPQPVGAALSIA